MAQQQLGTPKNAIALLEKDITDSVLKRVNGLVAGKQLMLPQNYSAENALKEAFLIIKKTVDKDKHLAMDVCTKDSIANALLDMTIQGLNPVKKQCYFIVYGKELQLDSSYFGVERALKNVIPSITKVPVQVIYQGDEVEYQIYTDPVDPDRIGERVITKHMQKFENMNNPIIGAYGYIVAEKDGKPYLMASDLMSISEIYASWRQSKMNPFDDKGALKPYSTHGKFPVEMTKRTLIRRLCKRPINTSDDEALYREAKKAFLRTTENEYSDKDWDIDGEFEEDPVETESPKLEANPEKKVNVVPQQESLEDMFEQASN